MFRLLSHQGMEGRGPGTPLWVQVLRTACAAACALVVFAADGYQKPPKAVMDVLNAPDTPQVSLSPAKTHIVMSSVVRNPSIADISRPMLRLAGLRIDPASNGQHLVSYTSGLAVKSLTDMKESKVATPAGVRISGIEWSPDGSMAAFLNATDRGTELWLVEIATGKSRKVAGVAVNSALGDALAWMPDNKTLVVATVPAGRGAAPVKPETPAGPRIQQSLGTAGATWTFQDMLSSPHDEALFDYYCTRQLVKLDVASGKTTPIGKPGLHFGVQPSPAGQHLLVSTAHRPYSYLLPYAMFAREVEVWDTGGRMVEKVASLALAEKIPVEGVQTGPRMTNWRPADPATLVWVEAMDGGNPKEKVPHRDRLVMKRIGSAGEPTELARIEHRVQGGGFQSQAMQWLPDGRLLVSEFERNRRWTRTFLVEPGKPGQKQIFSRNSQDRYRDKGAPVLNMRADGTRVVAADGNTMLLRGDGASPKGDRPFVDRFSLDTLQSERLFESDPGKYQELAGDLGGGRLLIRSESATEPPNYFIRDAAGKLTAVTTFPDPAPQLRKIKKQLVTYKRADGVPLSFTLYLPPDYKEGTRMPTVVWAYPREFGDADTAGQVSGSTNRFSNMVGASHLYYLLAGYVVLDNATMPVIGDTETMNNTYLEQIVASAKAAIDKAVEMGVTDRDRVGVGGHSYGGFMTANLLAHSDLFRAGAARSGAYNRTLTPFGFQSERRTLWEAPDTYLRMSPFMHANKIKEPILLIHGEADNNTGTYPIQSERMYQAIRGNGGTVRLVFLPHESHGYSAQESIEHTLYEMISWFDQYVKNAPQRASD